LQPEATNTLEAARQHLKDALAAARSTECAFLAYLIEMALVEAEQGPTGKAGTTRA
jgi:hypothetical protein